ncbi:ankyrin repeat domain-containing protein [Lentzea indica]|uniref:ankyrin repeat domain-containing protein n=1 Tax=Lentzea indica TaxID=2604800 RepID=UPI001CB7155B
MTTLPADDPLATALTTAIHTGDTDRLRQLLHDHSDLATRINGRSPLHIATDWPGHFPNVANTIAVLVDAGAKVNARSQGSHTETPLHWAASSDNVEALDALLDAGADNDAHRRRDARPPRSREDLLPRCHKRRSERGFLGRLPRRSTAVRRTPPRPRR